MISILNKNIRNVLKLVRPAVPKKARPREGHVGASITHMMVVAGGFESRV